MGVSARCGGMCFQLQPHVSTWGEKGTASSVPAAANALLRAAQLSEGAQISFACY